MIITQERLITLAEEAVERWAKRQPILAAYLIGSVLDEKPLLGGAADIDIVIIEHDQPLIQRQMQPLSDDVHLDMAFHPRDMYSKPRVLRVDPWLGPSLWHHHRLYDPKHFFDWAQAGAAAQFQRPENVRGRAMALLESARSLHSQSTGPRWLTPYLLATMNGLNAAVSLAGQPASGRRIVRTAGNRLAILDLQELLAGFLGLIDAIEPDEWHMPDWLGAWARAFDAQAEFRSADLADPRRDYYLRGFQALAEAGDAVAVIYPLLKTWSEILENIESPDSQAQHRAAFEDVRDSLRLSDDHRGSRFGQLEAFLDRVELSIEDWARQHGI